MILTFVVFIQIELSIKENEVLFSNSEYTDEEDKLIMSLYLKLGLKWTKMSNVLHTRSQISIKYRI